MAWRIANRELRQRRCNLPTDSEIWPEFRDLAERERFIRRELRDNWPLPSDVADQIESDLHDEFIQRDAEREAKRQEAENRGVAIERARGNREENDEQLRQVLGPSVFGRYIEARRAEEDRRAEVLEEHDIDEVEEAVSNENSSSADSSSAENVGVSSGHESWTSEHSDDIPDSNINRIPLKGFQQALWIGLPRPRLPVGRGYQPGPRDNPGDDKGESSSDGGRSTDRSSRANSKSRSRSRDRGGNSPLRSDSDQNGDSSERRKVRSIRRKTRSLPKIYYTPESSPSSSSTNTSVRESSSYISPNSEGPRKIGDHWRLRGFRVNMGNARDNPRDAIRVNRESSPSGQNSPESSGNRSSDWGLYGNEELDLDEESRIDLAPNQAPNNFNPAPLGNFTAELQGRLNAYADIHLHICLVGDESHEFLPVRGDLIIAHPGGQSISQQNSSGYITTYLGPGPDSYQYNHRDLILRIGEFEMVPGNGRRNFDYKPFQNLELYEYNTLSGVYTFFRFLGRQASLSNPNFSDRGDSPGKHLEVGSLVMGQRNDSRTIFLKPCRGDVIIKREARIESFHHDGNFFCSMVKWHRGKEFPFLQGDMLVRRLVDVGARGKLYLPGGWGWAELYEFQGPSMGWVFWGRTQHVYDTPYPPRSLDFMRTYVYDDGEFTDDEMLKQDVISSRRG